MKAKKKIISLATAAMLVAGMIPMAVSADGEEAAIQLGASQIEGSQTDSVYYGTYQQSSDGSDGYSTDPIKWRVLSNADEKLFLLSDQNLDAQTYNKVENAAITWERSTIRSWLNGYGSSSNDAVTDYTNNNFINTAFSTNEQEEIATTEVVNANNPDYSTPGGNNTEDKIFLLSIAEATNPVYGFTDNYSSTDTRVSTNTGYVAGYDGMLDAGKSGIWWLRSPGCDSYNAAAVYIDGELKPEGGLTCIPNCGVRPVFNLNLESVLFTSAAVGGKSSGDEGIGTLTAVSTNGDVKDWKLTLLDSSRASFTVKTSTNSTTTQIAGYSSWLIDIEYRNAKEGNGEYVSAMLCDKDDNVLYYGNIAKNCASGTAAVNIPTGLAGGEYTLKVFSEQCNGDKKTDYASAFQEIELTVVPRENTPEAQIAYEHETLTDLKEGSYTISWGESQSDTYTVDSGETTLDINSSWFGQTISIVKEGNGTTTADSQAQSLLIPERPAAPSVNKTDETVDGNEDGAITGTNTTMEYRQKTVQGGTENTWEECKETSVTGLAPGTYEVRYKAVSTSGQEAFASKIAEVTIGKGEPRRYSVSVSDVTFTDATYGYTQPSAQTVTITNNGNVSTTVTNVQLTGDDADSFTLSRTDGQTGNITIGTGTSDTNTSYTIQPVAGLTPGTYEATIQVTYNTDGDPDTATKAVTFRVGKAAPAASHFIFTAPSDLTYDGEGKSAAVSVGTGIEGMGDITVEYKNSNEDNWSTTAPTSAGSYDVRIQVAEGKNYQKADNLRAKNWSFEIEQAENSWTTELSITGWTYGEEANAPTAKAAFGDVKFTYSREESGNYTDAIPTGAGEWYVKATVEGTADYTGLEKTESFNIAKAVPQSGDFTFAAPENLTYDGNEKTATVKAKDDIEGMGSVKVKYYDADGQVLNGAPTEAGDYTVKIDVEEGDNYLEGQNITATSWSFTVVKQPQEPTDRSGASNDSSAQTGDDSNMALYGVLALIAAAVATGVVLYGRKKKQN